MCDFPIVKSFVRFHDISSVRSFSNQVNDFIWLWCPSSFCPLLFFFSMPLCCKKSFLGIFTIRIVLFYSVCFWNVPVMHPFDHGIRITRWQNHITFIFWSNAFELQKGSYIGMMVYVTCLLITYNLPTAMAQ